MNIYIGGKNLLEGASDKSLVNLLRPVLNLRNRDEQTLLDKFGDYFKSLQLVENIEDADFCVLPLPLNDYYLSGRKKAVAELSNRCQSLNKPLVIHVTGDFGVTPLSDNDIIIRQSGYQSKRLKKQFASTVFITDPLAVFFNSEFSIREKGAMPKVGFCGQAVDGVLHSGYNSLRTMMRNGAYHLGLSYYEPQTVYSSSRRRSKLLSLLESSSLVETDFIKRGKYRAGATTEEERYRTTMEFFNSIINTDYTLCVRGGGNFSVRIYETMALGRIPLFVNTDSILPFDDQIDWKQHLVWVEEADLKRVGEILADFHQSIHPDDFKQLQINNRNMWLKYLSGEGFHKQLIECVIKKYAHRLS